MYYKMGGGWFLIFIKSKSLTLHPFLPILTPKQSNVTNQLHGVLLNGEKNNSSCSIFCKKQYLRRTLLRLLIFRSTKELFFLYIKSCLTH